MIQKPGFRVNPFRDDMDMLRPRKVPPRLNNRKTSPTRMLAAPMPVTMPRQEVMGSKRLTISGISTRLELGDISWTAMAFPQCFRGETSVIMAMAEGR